MYFYVIHVMYLFSRSNCYTTTRIKQATFIRGSSSNIKNWDTICIQKRNNLIGEYSTSKFIFTFCGVKNLLDKTGILTIWIRKSDNLIGQYCASKFTFSFCGVIELIEKYDYMSFNIMCRSNSASLISLIGHRLSGNIDSILPEEWKIIECYHELLWCICTSQASISTMILKILIFWKNI